MIRPFAAPSPERLAQLSALHRAAFEPAARGWSAEEIASLARTGLLLADEAELLTIAVHPDHLRKGLARDLMETGRRRLVDAGMAVIHLEVAADNRAAIALYEGGGFAITGRRRGYYARPDGPPVDAVMMALCLSPPG